MFPGTLYLAASADRLDALVARAMSERRPKHVAVTYAAAAGHANALLFMQRKAAQMFRGAHVTRFVVRNEGDEANARDAEKTVRDADSIFVAGGDPALGARVLVEAGADAWLREARGRGASFVGVSAGAMMLGAWWAAWPDSDEHPEAVRAPFDGGSLVPCLGVAPGLVIDCHAEEDAWSELALVAAMLEARGEKFAPPAFHQGRAVAILPGAVALLGLPTGCGLVVHPGGELEIVGAAPFVFSAA